MYKSILVAIDGSELANKALTAALDLARQGHASLTIVTTTEPVGTGLGSGGFGSIDAGPILARLEEAHAMAANTILAEARHTVQDAGMQAKTLYLPRRFAADGIVDAAAELGADLIVMGSHGRRGLNRLILGSQASEVLARATIPVLIVK